MDRKLGDMERQAHRRYPRHRVGYGPHSGEAKRATLAGVLRVTYGGDLRWRYELDGRSVSREDALAAVTVKCPCTCCDH